MWSRDVENARDSLYTGKVHGPVWYISMTTRVYFIRHSETDWSLDGRHTGSTDVPLTAQGEQSARKLGTRLTEETFSRVISSPRIRARRTCELMGLVAAMEIDPDLGEWNYGDYEGRRTAEIQTEHPDWNIFRDGCPGGESPAQIGTRVDRVIARIRQADGNVAIFSHGHFGRVFGARWIGLRVDEAQHLLLTPTSLSLLDWNPSASPSSVISLWNANTEQL